MGVAGIAGAALAACASTAAAKPSPKPASTPAVAYQLNDGHTGVTPDAMAARPTRRWSVTFAGAVSYPLIADGMVFVTVQDSGGYGTKLYGLSASTGATVEGPFELGGVYNWSGLTYAGGQVFTVNASGVMEAFSTATGGEVWSTQLPGQTLFTSPPTAANGYVYTGGAGSGGTVYAVNQNSGTVAWTGSVENGDHSSPAVSAGGVYVSYACGQTYDFAPLTGQLTWHRNTACEGGGGKTPVLADGRLFVRDFSYPAVLNPSTGSLLAPFASSGPAPAVDQNTVYDLNGGSLAASNVTSGAEDWSFAGDGTLDTAPIEAGGTVFVGGSSGGLYGLSAATGRVTWSTQCRVRDPGARRAERRRTDRHGRLRRATRGARGRHLGCLQVILRRPRSRPWSSRQRRWTLVE